MQDIIDPPDIQFLRELHQKLDELIIESSEWLLGRSISIILEKPQLASEEKCGNRCSLHYTVPLRVPGEAVSAGLRVELSVRMYRRF